MLYDVLTGAPVGVLQLIALLGGLLLYHMVLRGLRNRRVMFHVDVHRDSKSTNKPRPYIGLSVVAISASGSHRSVSLTISSQENSSENHQIPWRPNRHKR